MDPNWVMVFITGVYVIATIAICVANFKSAKASKMQLEVMKKQYEEENRPYVEVELHYERHLIYSLRFVNHGKQTAQRFRVDFNHEFTESLPEPSFRRNIEKQKGKECIIGVGQHYDLFIGSNKLREITSWVPIKGRITYQSNGNLYESDIFIDLENYMTFFSINEDNREHKEWMDVLRENNKTLTQINNSIQGINQNKKEEKADA